jgi:Mn2+/Fe2+ NRAMP family transporter
MTATHAPQPDVETKPSSNSKTAKDRSGLRGFLRGLGPGLITGAADDDPSGIATYTQTGAQFGYGQLWTALYMLPFLIAVQEACARIGAVSGSGLSAAIKRHYRREIVLGVVLLVVVANVINAGADIGALAAAANLIVPINPSILAVGATLVILGLEVFVSYPRYASFLKWLTLSLWAYLLTALLVHEPWPVLLRATVIPHFELSFGFLFIIVGVFGTTITPYMFFWQSDQEVEEEKQRGMIDHDGRVAQNRLKAFLHVVRLDTVSGMVVSEIATWSMIVVGATVLHQNGVTSVNTAADAAKALVPLVQTFPHSGVLAELIFAAGIVGLGMLAIPVLTGSAAYVFCEAANWSEGLNLELRQAHGFYGVIALATMLALGMNFLGINPMKALVFASVVNGVVAVPLLILVALIAQSNSIMGSFKSGALSRILLWTTAVVMGGAAIAMFVTLGH